MNARSAGQSTELALRLSSGRLSFEKHHRCFSFLLKQEPFLTPSPDPHSRATLSRKGRGNVRIDLIAFIQPHRASTHHLYHRHSARIRRANWLIFCGRLLMFPLGHAEPWLGDVEISSKVGSASAVIKLP